MTSNREGKSGCGKDSGVIDGKEITRSVETGELEGDV